MKNTKDALPFVQRILYGLPFVQRILYGLDASGVGIGIPEFWRTAAPSRGFFVRTRQALHGRAVQAAARLAGSRTRYANLYGLLSLIGIGEAEIAIRSSGVLS